MNNKMRNLVFLFLLFFIFGSFPIKYILALSTNITQIKFTNSPQTVNVNTLSAVLTTQTQNAGNASESVSATTVLNLASNSATGVFYNANASACTSLLTAPFKLTMSSGSANKNFCYKDSVQGTHTLTITAEGKTWTTATQNIIIPDTTSPTITLIGSNPQTILIGQAYIELGAIVSDNVDAELTATIDASTVSTNQVGSYAVKYNATDLSENHATEVTRTVNIADQEVPVITLNGDNPQNIEVHGSYAELGATVSDNVDTGLTATIDASLVNTNTLGNYSVRYDTVDSSSNHATQVTRMVNIVDTTKPIITLVGENTINLTVSDTYTEQNAAVSDNYDNTATITTGGDTVNTLQAGTYHISYDAVDSSGNHANQIIRAVVVIAAIPKSSSVNLSATTTEATITNPNQIVNITVENGTVDPSINLGSFITAGSGNIPEINITSLAASNIVIAIPSTTITSANPSWNGVIALPKITTVTLPETSGELKTLSTAIEVGSIDTKLSFNNAVRILLPGEASKKIGFSRTGINFTEITETCFADDQTAGNNLAVDGDCKIDVGSDLVIWTKHFTKFATYTVTVTTVPNRGSSHGGRAALPIAGSFLTDSSSTPSTIVSDASANLTTSTYPATSPQANIEQTTPVPNATSIAYNTPLVKNESSISKNKKITSPKLEANTNTPKVNPDTLIASAVEALPNNAYSNKIPMIVGILSSILLLASLWKLKFMTK